MTSVERASIVIVGGGAAGLASAASLARRGIASVVLEQSGQVGSSWAGRYERLHLHTHRLLSGLPYRRVPRAATRYASKDAYARYLADYARALDLDVRTGCSVASVTQADGYWEVASSSGTFTADAVVMATGLYRAPRLPDWRGADELGDDLLHASAYGSGSTHRGARVLVVGVGNTGAELATDLVEQGAGHVAISIRTVPPISPRDVMGVPSQAFGIALSMLPRRIADRINGIFRRLGPDLSPWGLATPGWQTFAARRPPVIDVGFIARLQAGSISVLPALSHFERGEAVFVDGSRERFDTVVAATGYDPGLAPLLNDVPGALTPDGHPRDGVPGLYFLGFTPTLRGQLLEIRRGAPKVARRIAAHLRDVEQAHRQQE